MYCLHSASTATKYVIHITLSLFLFLCIIKRMRVQNVCLYHINRCQIIPSKEKLGQGCSSSNPKNLGEEEGSHVDRWQVSRANRTMRSAQQVTRDTSTVKDVIASCFVNNLIVSRIPFLTEKAQFRTLITIQDLCCW